MCAEGVRSYRTVSQRPYTRTELILPFFFQHRRSMASRLKALLKRKGASSLSDDPVDAIRPSLLRRQKLLVRVHAFAPVLRNLLIVVGLLYTVALPYKGLGRKHYISENALQPGHVRTTLFLLPFVTEFTVFLPCR